MFFVPMGIWQDTPGVTVGLYIWKGIIPALLGNIVGRGLFVRTYFWYMYLEPGSQIIDGVEFHGQNVGRLELRSGHVDLGRRKRTADEETLASTPPNEMTDSRK